MYLGIDLGTSSIKVSLANQEGEIIDSASREYPLFFPRLNWSEQNPDDWYNALVDVFNELRTRHDLSKIKSLSFCGQMHGLVILDEFDNVIRPAILWNDGRVVDEVEFLNNDYGINKLIEETSNIALCGFTAPKLLWLKKNEPDNFKRIKKIMLPKDYLAYKISSCFASDISDLSGSLFFDVKNNKYSKDILKLLDISEEQLPKIYNSYDVIGNVSKTFADISGLTTDTKVVIGGGDQAVGATGTNTLNDGSLFISLGTSGVVFSSSDDYRYDKHGRIHSFRHTTGKFLLMGCTLSAAASLKWWFEDVLNINDYQDEISKIPEQIDNILFLPYLTGERSPINDPNATGIFANLNAFYKRSNLTKAVLEGVSFSLYDNYRVMEDLGLKFDSAKVIGGGSKSKEWLQILSDIFGIKMQTINTKDGGSLGAIILAMVGDGVFKSVADGANKLVKICATFTPNTEKHKEYLLKFKKYKDLYLKNK